MNLVSFKCHFQRIAIKQGVQNCILFQLVFLKQGGIVEDSRFSPENCRVDVAWVSGEYVSLGRRRRGGEWWLVIGGRQLVVGGCWFAELQTLCIFCRRIDIFRVVEQQLAIVDSPNHRLPASSAKESIEYTLKASWSQFSARNFLDFLQTNRIKSMFCRNKLRQTALFTKKSQTFQQYMQKVYDFSWACCRVLDFLHFLPKSRQNIRKKQVGANLGRDSAQTFYSQVE